MQRSALTFFLYLLLFGVFAQSEDRITLTIEAPIPEVLKTISDQTHLKFAYNTDLMPEKMVTINLRNASLDNAMEQILPGNLTYKVRGSYVVVLTRPPDKSIKQPREFSGEVLDSETGKALAWASVYEVSALQAALTSPKGTYQLKTQVPTEISYLAISRQNYQDTIIAVSKNSGFFRVFLKPDKPKVNESKSDESTKLFGWLTSQKLKTHTRNVQLEETRWVHLALVPGISTNGFFSGSIRNRLSFNVIAGYAYGLNGVELGGFANLERMDAQGFQAAGAVNVVGKRFTGAQFGGATNISLASVQGVQFAGASNHTQDVSGVQMAGAVNTSSSVSGAQVAGFANFNSKRMKGAQISGFINRTGTLNGVQIGVVNIARTVESGVTIGLINWVGDGLKDLSISANDVTPYNLAFKSGTKAFYAVLSSGIDPYNDQLWSYGLGFGTEWNVAPWLAFTLEASQHVIQPLDAPVLDGYNGDNRLALHGTLNLAKNFTIYGGPLFHYFVYNSREVSQNNFVHRITRNPSLDTSSGNRRTLGWVGFEFGFRF